MNPEAIKEKFKNLTVWKRGSKRAPHKPLLVLYAISRALRDKSRLIPYVEIETELTKLLAAFSPYARSYRPYYPFWRLQNEGIWSITNSEKVRVNNSGDANPSELRHYNVAGGFNEYIFTALMSDKKLTQEIIRGLLDNNFPSSVHEDICQSLGLSLELEPTRSKTRNPQFRDMILRAYEYRCAICGFDVRISNISIALEAAHIKWHIAGGPDIEENGLALCALHHKLFDRGAFTMSSELEIMVSDRAHGTTGFQEWLMKYHGHKIMLPHRTVYYPNPKFRTWHVKEVFQGEYREIR